MSTNRPKSLGALVAASLLAAGCASQQSNVADDQQKMVKIYRTGSALPIMVPYMGPEHVRYIEAQGNREAIDQIVSPPIPLKSN
jgi:hypothetical protein